MASTSLKNFRLSQSPNSQAYEPPLPTLVNSSTPGEDCKIVKLEIPGVNPATVEVSCEGNLLAVRCEKGEYTQQLDPTINISEIKADVQWGMLTLVIPTPPAPSLRTIKVSVYDTAPAPTKSSTSKSVAQKATSEES